MGQSLNNCVGAYYVKQLLIKSSLHISSIFVNKPAGSSQIDWITSDGVRETQWEPKV